MRNIFFRLLIVSGISIVVVACGGKTGEQGRGQNGDATDTVVTPAGFTKMAEEHSDLNKDGKAELVVVYDTPEEGEMGTERRLCIYKKDGAKWQLWHENKTAVLSSEHGGMMGDPFQEVKIKNGCIVVSHYGGSRDKWSYDHVYRYQDNGWHLIGATVHYFVPCEFSKTFDYNLSTGHIDFTSSVTECDDSGDNEKEKSTKKLSFVRKIEPPLMDKFMPGENEVKMPEGEEGFYY